jgi:hypothetical protein
LRPHVGFLMDNEAPSAYVYVISIHFAGRRQEEPLKDFGPELDIGFLVKLDPEHIPGLLRIVRMEGELSELLGRKVDLRTAGDLSATFVTK